MEKSQENDLKHAMLQDLGNVLKKIPNEQGVSLDVEIQNVINEFLVKYGEEKIKEIRKKIAWGEKEDVLCNAHSSQQVIYFSQLLGDSEETTTWLAGRCSLRTLFGQEVNF